MAESLYEIPKDKFSNELGTELFKVSRRDATNNELYNLQKLINCELTDIAIRELLKCEGFILPKTQTENIEILARINDAKFILGDNDKLNCIQKSVGFYIEIYEQINDLKYLIRALELVRKVKSVFEQKLLQLEEKILQVFPLLQSSYFELRLAEAASFLMQESSSKILIDYVITQLDKSYESKDYIDVQNYIIVLNKLGHFNNNESKIQIAFCLEKKADFYISQKKPDTYYPNILRIYTDALKEVKGIPIDEAFKSRLQRKIKIEQSIYFEMLKKIGVPTKSGLSITELVSSQTIVDFKSGFNFLMQFPIIDTAALKSKNEERDKKFFFGHFFKDFVHITNKGTVSGKSNEETYYLNLSREHYRNTTISIIREIKSIMDFDKQVSKDLVSTMIVNYESPFIPEDREYFFIEGIYHGFKNNFVLASHILIPQIENSLKNLIELNGRNTTKLTEEIQNDNTLGSILRVEENNKMLDRICDRDLIIELNNYLVNGNSVNFRNRLCHGLISPFETDYYGIYLWWLTLKMVKQTNEYFTLPV